MSSAFFQKQSAALGSALRVLLEATPDLHPSAAGMRLSQLSLDLIGPSSTEPEVSSLLQTGIQELKNLVTAYHEAGHLLAYRALIPPGRIHLDDVRFIPQQDGGRADTGVTYTWTSEPRWPDPAVPDEVVRELACVLAGKYAEPGFGAAIRLDGTDLDDQSLAHDLLDLLPPAQRIHASEKAYALLAGLSIQRHAPALAARLYQRWTAGDQVIPVAELEPLLVAGRL